MPVATNRSVDLKRAMENVPAHFSAISQFGPFHKGYGQVNLPQNQPGTQSTDAKQNIAADSL